MTAQTLTVHPVPVDGRRGRASSRPTAPSSPAPRTARSGALDPATATASAGSPTPAAARSASSCCPTATSSSATRSGACCGCRPRTGAVEVLVGEVDGEPMRFCNNAAIAGDGTIWFSDSSLHYGIEQWKDDFVQHTRTGRLLRRDPDGTVDGGARRAGVRQRRRPRRRRVLRRRGRVPAAAPSYASGWPARARGSATTSSRTCPGYPDNISRGSDGLIWVDGREPGRRPRRAARHGPDAAAQGGHPDPRGAPAQARSGRSGCRPTTTTAGSCTTSTCRARARRRLPHGHRRPGARRPALAGEPPRAGGGGHTTVHEIDSRPMAHPRLDRAPRSDLRGLSAEQLDALAAEIRDLMIRTVATNSAATSAPTSASSS